jgi:hypothetical protein
MLSSIINIGINKVSDAPKTQSTGEGVSFTMAVAEAVKEGKITLPSGVQTGQLDLLRTKFGYDKGFKYEETDEDVINEFLAKINNILKESREKSK